MPARDSTGSISYPILVLSRRSSAHISLWVRPALHGRYTNASCFRDLLGSPLTSSLGAPFCILGELILLEGSIDRDGKQPRIERHSLEDDEVHQSPTPLPAPVTSTAASSSRPTPHHSRPVSRQSLSNDHSHSHDRISDLRDRKSRPTSLDLSRTNSRAAQQESDNLTPLIIQTGPSDPDGTDHSIIIHHSDSESEPDSATLPHRPNSPRSPVQGQAGNEIGDKAGVILGIHNLFLVAPQFIVTFLSSLIFALMEPDKGLPEHHPQANPVAGINTTSTAGFEGAMADMGALDGRGLLRRAEAIGTDVSSPDAVGLIFR